MKEYKYKINGNDYKVAIGDIEHNIAKVEVNGVPYKVELEQKKSAPIVIKSVKPSQAPRTETGAKVISKPTVSAGQASVKAPLPGVIIDIKVNVGDTVSPNDVVAILEAMKSRNCDIDALTQMTRRAAEIIEECRSRLTTASSDLQDILEKLGK